MGGIFRYSAPADVGSGSSMKPKRTWGARTVVLQDLGAGLTISYQLSPGSTQPARGGFYLSSISCNSLVYFFLCYIAACTFLKDQGLRCAPFLERNETLGGGRVGRRGKQSKHFLQCSSASGSRAHEPGGWMIWLQLESESECVVSSGL